MKLQLLIPQYNEDESVVKNMLDSLKVQQSVDFNDFEVLIGNDGSDIWQGVVIILCSAVDYFV